MENSLKVVGARGNNLKNITVEIPRDKFTVITGLSGSGKSSLAFDTIFAEGQRRYVESLSSYARQFLGQMDKPDVDVIEGLSPAVSIDQKGTSRNPRSTVGTVTEIYDYFRLMFARIGIPHCPVCGREVTKQSAEEITNTVAALPDGTRIMVLAPIVRARKGTYQAVLEDIRKAGFVRVRIDGTVYSVDDEITLDRYKIHTIEAVVDRIVIHHDDADEEERKNRRTRLADSIETALKAGEGFVTVADLSTDPVTDMQFSEFLACPEHGYSIPEIEPRTFSFNTPHGACPACQGLGVKYEIDPELVIPDDSLSLNQGAVAVMEWKPAARPTEGYYWQQLMAVCEAYEISPDAPINTLTKQQRSVLLYGSGKQTVKIELKGRNDRRSSYNAPFEGIIPNLQRRYNETSSDYIKNQISQFMREIPCKECGGKRLRPEALAVTVDGKNIIEVTDWAVSRTLSWMHHLNEDSNLLSAKQRVIAEKVFKEITSRLEFLVNVGLDYLTLSRSAVTLSGGEAQRIRLATQIGSQLMGVLYVLDEPSIGLHARDNTKLLRTLQQLRDLGNTVIVVEHDEETIRSADWIVDMGPGAGVNGGEVLVSGTVQDVLDCPRSLTGDYLSGRKFVPVPKKRRKPGKEKLEIIGAAQNNLKNINVKIPLGMFVCITGVSGSGKSSLMNEILYKSLAHTLNRAHTTPGKHKEIRGTQYLDKIINIDQSPIGRTPRSNPGTYTGVFDEIRKLFADLPESKLRGYTAGRFSFNVHGGRCEACQGQGQLKIEMQFLPDVYVPCEVCHGTGYNHETLQVKYKGKSIADVLDMTVDDGVEFFSVFESISGKLKLLQQVGLGYLKIGQSGNTLSGGEAQRIKLSKELSRRATGRTLYVLDEPSVGLHAADVHKLIEVMEELVAHGNSVLVIEHNMDIIKVADYLIDLGPEGGDKGGNLVACGAPEDVAKVEESYTGQYLKAALSEIK
ncbi:MAG: excinuclease ABC subunit UvrA [Anaerolineaceae bacterium]|nr:excinuclease ABC subunit UvrA [Anaerolineaceae bacterium]